MDSAVKKIDSLVNQIYEDGIDKAKQEAASIISDAEKKAAELKSKAEKETTEIKQTAKREAEQLRESVEAELKLASERILSDLQARLKDMISGKLASDVSKSSMEPELVREMILALMEKWDPQGNATGVEITLPEKIQSDLQSDLKARLAKELPELDILGDSEIAGGFRIKSKGQDFILDFSDEALYTYFKAFLRDRTARLIFSESPDNR